MLKLRAILCALDTKITEPRTLGEDGTNTVRGVCVPAF
jgi:hypothetical protein